MRGEANPQPSMFSYVDLEKRIPQSHQIRKIRKIVDIALEEIEPSFDEMYASQGRPSIPPEQLLRALLLQILFTVRSERQLMERIDYDLLFRWFVGLGVDDPVWNHSTFSKNRERLLSINVDELFFEAIKPPPINSSLASISPSTARCLKPVPESNPSNPKRGTMKIAVMMTTKASTFTARN